MQRGPYECMMNICNSNMSSCIGYINNAVIKLRIYFNSHMDIVKQIININSKRFHAFIWTQQILKMLKREFKTAYRRMTNNPMAKIKKKTKKSKSIDPLWYFRFTASDYHFDILDLRLLITPLVS
jgi:hypothetical protein